MCSVVHLLHLLGFTGDGEKRRGLVEGRQKNKIGRRVLLMLMLIGFVGAHGQVGYLP